MSKDVLGSAVMKLVTVPEQFLGTLADFCEKLASKEGYVWWIAFKRFLRKENPWGNSSFRIWKTSYFGTERTDFVQVTPTDLGLTLSPGETMFSDKVIVARAYEVGLVPCSYSTVARLSRKLFVTEVRFSLPRGIYKVSTKDGFEVESSCYFDKGQIFIFVQPRIE